MIATDAAAMQKEDRLWRRYFKTVIIAGVVSITLLTGGAVFLLYHFTHHAGPSAWCRQEVTRIATLQRVAQLQMDSIGSEPFGAPGTLSTFYQAQAEVKMAGQMLKQVKAAGCPNGGYKGGITLGN